MSRKKRKKKAKRGKNGKELPYIPRVVVTMDTGTKTILSKKDKARTRRSLNRETREGVDRLDD